MDPFCSLTHIFKYSKQDFRADGVVAALGAFNNTRYRMMQWWVRGSRETSKIYE